MIEYLDTPVFGEAISILAYTFSSYIARRTGLKILNPLLVAVIMIIGFLLATGVGYDTFNKGGEMITFFLGPATVVLAVPLYRQWNLLKDNLMPILVGIIVGSLSGIACIIILGKVLGLDIFLISSMVPKSTTSPIAMEISSMLGGDPSITVSFVIVTGIAGYIIGERVLQIFGVDDPIAKGIGMGTSAHAVGTAKAIEMGEVEGAMSSLAIGVAGLVTVLFVPVILLVLSII